MKRFLPVLLVLLLAAGIFLFRDPLLDLLPIDQSGWSANEYGTCYLNEKGDPVYGWQEIDGMTYYFSPETAQLHTGWAERSGNRYYVNQGIPLSGWQTLEGCRYYFRSDGVMHTGWLEQDGQRQYLQSDGVLASGWTETPEGTVYLDEAGVPCSGITETGSGIYYFREGLPCGGWQEAEGSRYYFLEDGSMYTGWLEDEGHTYYLREDGTAATGKVEIDGSPYFFSSTGVNFILVNPWHPLPEDYAVEVALVEGAYLGTDCIGALREMFADCRAAGGYPVIMSGYRNLRDQTALFENMLREQLHRHSTYESAYRSAAEIVAVPGTSEHHLGLAVDIVDGAYTELNQYQENMPTQQWLMEHCWDYGFILRYPNGTTEITGIIYEPWHYRYVGIEMAQEIRELGVCLEEYVDMLTADGSTCGGQ